MKTSPILDVAPLGFPWVTLDPFLFCVHHDDDYPEGNEQLGPRASLAGRQIGMDFEGIDGWRMYHGDVVPGFPQHPHRGFETVTLARQGYIDHSDSLGATARFGKGDVQWMTAGRGVVHCEMFPLLEPDRRNPVELFQIWLNLPHADKMVAPHFSMLWSHTIPTERRVDERGRVTEVTVVAGDLGSSHPPAPPPHSWASRPDANVAIWSIRMEAEAHFQLPKTTADTNRMLYFFRGQSAQVAGHTFEDFGALHVQSDVDLELAAGPEAVEFLLLQGRPIGEPVVQYGPFVMCNSREIQDAYRDYQNTGFGGWPWPSAGPVHARHQRRFAHHADGRREEVE